MPTEDSATGIVEESLQPVSFRLGAPRPDNITIIERRENVRFKEEILKRRGCGRHRVMYTTDTPFLLLNLSWKEVGYISRPP